MNISIKDWSFLQYWFYAAFPDCQFLQRYLSRNFPDKFTCRHQNEETQLTITVEGQEITIWMYRHHVEYRVGERELYQPCLAYDVVKALGPEQYLLLLPIVDMSTCDYRSAYVMADLVPILSKTAVPKEHIEELAYGICLGLVDGDGAEDTPLWVIWQDTEDARYGAAWWPDAEELDFYVKEGVEKYITAPKDQDIYLWAREMLSQWVLEISEKR